ncbi:hypothetical protein TNCT_585011 [Trichonephila clavata]|uniref:Uncharacterized protein n=1 Tax=Trichonephila clavata TaxID=2740835 RepID=A0A8X6LFQ5_TRICU|nr:hypothetical protein TNCT_585011 [Trichonephila clavata]
MYDEPGPPSPHEHGPKTFRGERVLYITMECWTTIFIFCIVMGFSLIITPIIVPPSEVLFKIFSAVGFFLVCVPSFFVGAIKWSIQKRKEAAEAELKRDEARRRRNLRVIKGY